MTYKTMYKSELAELAEVSYSTFYRYLLSRRKILEQMGVSIHSKTLPPKAVRYVCEDYCIDLPEDRERLKHIKFR